MKATFKIFLLATTFFGANTPHAFAQSAGSEADIVVTARRTEERLQDVPISITVFNQQQISNRNVVAASDLATYTPSLSTNTRYGSESSSFAIRGFTQEGQTSPSVAVYFADVVAPRAQGGTGSGNGAGVGSFFDLQNVQVLKGPQGTLFGRNTTGGAILLVPQRPTGRFEGYVEGSVGNYNLRRIQGVINIPVMDTLRIRVGVDRQTRDGYLKNISGIGPEDFADIDYTALRVSAVADLTPNLENYTVVTYGLSHTNGFYPRIYNQDNIARDPFPNLRASQLAQTNAAGYYAVANGNPNAAQRIRQWSIINTTTWRASDTLTLKNIASYSEFRQSQATNIYGENGYQNGTTLPYYAVAIGPQPNGDATAQSTFTEELQLQGRSENDRLNYQLGAYLELSEPLAGFQAGWSPNAVICTNIYAMQCQDRVPGAGGFITVSASKYHFRNLGFYGQGTFKLTNTISLTGGFRYTSDITSGLGQVLKISFPTANAPSYGCAQPPSQVQSGTPSEILADRSRCDFARRVTSAKPTWLIDVDWKPSDNMLVYAKYSRGYRQGSVNVSSYGLETWGPEKVDLYEIGAKTSFDGLVRGTFNVAAFYNDFSNQQIAINTVSCGNVAPLGPIYTTLFPACAGIPAADFPSPAQGIGNAGKSTIKGVEIDGSIRPFEGLSIDGSYAHLDTKLKEISIPAIPYGFARLDPAAILGGPLALTPRNKYAVTIGYTLPLPEKVGRLTLGGTFSHQDSTFGNASSVGAMRYLPPQNNLNLNVNWNNVAGTPVDVGLFATNVTKEKFYVFTTGASFGWDAVVLNQPRMYGLRLKYRFGS